jgi:hypothetical protein
MNAERRALDSSAPLNASKTVAGFREKKFGWREEEEMQDRTEAKGVRSTGESG